MEVFITALAVFAVIILVFFVAAIIAFIAGYGFTYGEESARQRLKERNGGAR